MLSCNNSKSQAGDATCASTSLRLFKKMKNHKIVPDVYIADLYQVLEGSVNSCPEKPRTKKVRHITLISRYILALYLLHG